MKITLILTTLAGLALAEDAKDSHAACKAEIEVLRARVNELALRIAAKEAAIQFFQLTQQADAAKTQADGKAVALEAAKPKEPQQAKN